MPHPLDQGPAQSPAPQRCPQHKLPAHPLPALTPAARSWPSAPLSVSLRASGSAPTDSPRATPRGHQSRAPGPTLSGRVCWEQVLGTAMPVRGAHPAAEKRLASLEQPARTSSWAGHFPFLSSPSEGSCSPPSTQEKQDLDVQATCPRPHPASGKVSMSPVMPLTTLRPGGTPQDCCGRRTFTKHTQLQVLTWECPRECFCLLR